MTESLEKNFKSSFQSGSSQSCINHLISGGLRNEKTDNIYNFHDWLNVSKIPGSGSITTS
jgi:hypothetical protein